MAQTRESAVPNKFGLHRLALRVAPGLSDAALAELTTAAERLRREEGLPPVELTAQW
ncbi:hypothetical protein [Nocardia inohanensis]|uniref:hypothetical protein n=1 Tax=Nocardia inohanensis TaxID=209246 RepID=UPI000A42CCC0|nr:hypothetical protein [Nocardia inohanensis]